MMEEPRKAFQAPENKGIISKAIGQDRIGCELRMSMSSAKPGYHKVYTDLRFDSRGNRVYEDYYWEPDDAPVALCGGGPSQSSVDKQNAISQEQVDLANK